MIMTVRMPAAHGPGLAERMGGTQMWPLSGIAVAPIRSDPISASIPSGHPWNRPEWKALDTHGPACDVSSMFWIALAAQISAPAPEMQKSWFSADDVPSYLVDAAPGIWQVPVRVIVAPDGKVRSCDVESAGGMANLKSLTCGIMMRRGKFRAANVDGVPTFGVYRTNVKWAVTDGPFDTSKVMSADLEVALNQLPAGTKSPTHVRVAFVVDSTGTKSACVADTTRSFDIVENDPALIPVACDQVMKSYSATPAKDAQGKPVLSVQTAVVRFVTGERSLRTPKN
jgi:hypothetical protein